MARRYSLAVLVLAVLGACWTFGPVDAGGKRSDSEVKVDVTAAKPDSAGKVVITIQLEVSKGWHIYSNPVGNDDLAGAQTVVNVTGKTKPASVKIDYPKAHIINDKIVGKYGVYEEKVAIKATVQRAEGDTGPLEVSVKFNACNDQGTCLLPATVKKTVP